MLGQARRWWSASRRRRRRLTWLAVLVAVSSTVASLIVWVHNTGTPLPNTPLRPGKVVVYRAPKSVALTHEQIVAAQVTTYRFLSTAVVRRHVGDSYALMAPALRAGYTKERWAKGEIPVVPYPVDLKRVAYRIDYSYGPSPPDGQARVGMEISMHPKQGSALPAMVFSIELESAGTGARKHWVVSQWGPEGSLGGEPQGAKGTPPEEAPKGQSLSVKWLLIPAGLLGAIVLVPLALALRGWYRHRRVARAYARSLEL
jgi:hypothetical protein